MEIVEAGIEHAKDISALMLSELKIQILNFPKK